MERYEKLALADDFQPNSKSLGEMYEPALKELLDPVPSIPLTAMPQLNSLLGGFRMREFTILCAPTGAGKTTLLANWAKSLLADSRRAFVMSVETGATDFVKRAMSAFLGADLNTGEKVSKDTLRSFQTNFGKYFTSEGLYLSLYDNRIHHEKVLAEILWHKRFKGCDIVFIDNLNFLLEVVADNRQIEMMDKVVHDLIMFCKKVDIHIVMVMHPKKTEHGRVENEFDIKGSSTAVQEAHNVLLLNKPKAEDIKSGARGAMCREITIRKLRRMGQNVGKSVWVACEGGRYREIL